MSGTQGRVLVVGAGLSGAVLARCLAEAERPVVVLDRRNHLAGNCHSSRDSETGVMVHRYGPHIFHTDDQEVWDFVRRFGDFEPYVNRVKAVSGGKVYSLPINLMTINSLYGKSLNPEQARVFLDEVADHSILEPKTFEEQALRFVGPEIYRSFFYGYTKKQWGLEPSELPASILKRLPVRFNYDDNYYSHRFQGIPRWGYTSLVKALLDHSGIQVELQEEYSHRRNSEFDHVFYSGPLDEYYSWEFGRLAYRTLRFEAFRGEGDAQGCAVMNYCDEEVPYTRIAEHKHFSPWEEHEKTICFREFSSRCQPGDIPYYPVRRVREMSLFERYRERAEHEPGVTFVGRLGTYRYLDMDVSVREAMDAGREFLEKAPEV
jgi:UDP-galactopyranose mutase